MRVASTFFAVALSVLSCATGARAQCEPVWLTGVNVPAVNGVVNAMLTWDPDGNGPLSPMLVIGGNFSDVGGVAARSVASWNGQQWAPLDAGLSGEVRSLVVFDGHLFAGGGFTSSGATPVRSVARWNGTTWSSIAPALPSTVLAIEAHNGSLFAGQMSGTISRLDGDAWVTVGTANAEVRGLQSFNGELVAGGRFTSVSGVSASLCATWNGIAWRAMGNSPSGVDVNSMTIHNGELIAVGNFFFSGVSRNDIARWNGTDWNGFGTGSSSIIKAARSFAGNLYVVGLFTSISSVPAQWAARWDGSQWHAMGSGLSGGSWALTTTDFRGDIYVGGWIANAGGNPVQNLAAFGSPCRCPADLDDDGNFANGGARNNAVDINDLLYFLIGFEAGDNAIDLDNGSNTNTPDNAVDINDLLFFLARFEAGC